MAVEIEAKMKLDDEIDLVPMLEAAGARRLCRVIERDSFFDDSQGRLQSAGCGLRIRCRSFFEKQDQSEVYLVTCKGPLQQGDLKKRREIEFAVQSPQPVVQMLEMLGYHQVISYEKMRERWRLGRCMVELDRLPYLGRFVEIEGPDEAAVHEVRARLDLSEAPLLKTSYIAMLCRYLAEHGIKQRHIRLAD